MTAADPLRYLGNELELFAAAKNWKGYFHRQLSPYLVGDVLEVGAGIGTTAEVLCDGRQRRWVALEPDPALSEQMRQRIAARPLPCPTELRVGTTGDLADDERFDTILYIDVLEHIEHDRDELERAGRHLTPSGAIIVLCPAHNWLYSPFDKAIGHYRRYNRGMYRAVTPPSLRLERAWYLDSVGLLASLANRMILKASLPNAGQIRFWDSSLVPMSQWVDPLLARSLGKTIVGVWRLNGQ
jgi:SAM-dependent methyltransferase